MNFTIRIFPVLLVMTGLFMLPYQEAFSKSYTIPVIKVEVTIQPDGSVLITEHRTYHFEGSYSWADYRLPLRGFTNIRDLQVAENDKAFQNLNTEEPETFMVQRSDNSIRLKWFYEAEDEQRTFSISYTLEGALTIGPEWGQFFWNYISSDREKDTDSLVVDLRLPIAAGTDSITTWSRGSRDNITIVKRTDGYRAEALNIENDESVIIRSVFPRRVLNPDQVQTTDSSFSLEWAKKDEQTYREEQAALAEQNRRNAEYGKQLIILTVVISIGIFIFLYQRFGRRHSTRSVSATETIMIPGREKPAVIGWLMNNKSIGSHHLMATLLDLARRGYFIIEEREPEEKFFGAEQQKFSIRKSDTQAVESERELTEWESELLEFVNQQIADSNNQIDELFSASSFKAASWFSDWKQLLKNDCTQRGWYDNKSYTGAYANLGIQFVLLVPAILATTWSGPLGMIAIVTVGLMMIASFAIIRRTQEGETTHARWKAYKEGLQNAKDHSIGDDLIDKHFIYSIALGLSKNDIENLFQWMDNQEVAFVWFVLYNQGHQTYPAAAGTFSTLAATGTSTFPGSASAGTGSAAGASAGAAGGGAAGGAG